MSNPQYLSGQPDKRRSQRFTDQHDRKWSGIIEIKSGLPTGPIRPLDFNPPLDVPQEFIEYDPMEPSSIKIRYEKWIAALEDAKRKWEQRLVDRAQEMFGDQAGKYIKKPTSELLRRVGPEPKPVEPVQAAAAGNKWVLGLTPIKPKWAEKFFPEDEKELVHARRDRISTLDEETVDEWKDTFPDADEPEDNDEG